MKLFCFLDRVSGIWSDPTLSQSVPVLIRTLNDVLRGSRHPLFQHCADIDVYELGDFDEVSGRFPDGVKQEFCFHMADVFEEEKKE